jgi:hypothetical protein
MTSCTRSRSSVNVNAFMPSTEGPRRAHGGEKNERLRAVVDFPDVGTPPGEAGDVDAAAVGADAKAASRCLRLGWPRDMPNSIAQFREESLKARR